MRTFVCDIETYSSADLPRTGAVKYAEAEDFEILLLTYAFDDDPVQAWDFTAQGTPPWLADVLLDPDVLKVAWNYSFERACFNAYLGIYTPPEQWRDAMTIAAMNGLPMSLEACGAALQLEEQKLSTGKALINYFCKPCKPTISNGGRTRNLPEHAPDKWADFIEYGIRDTVTERTIYKRLQKFPVTDFERKLEALDARMNERGVLADIELAEAAVAVDDIARERHMAEMQQLTGLDNPNSVAQLKDWLETYGGLTVESLNKETIKDLLKKPCKPSVRRALELRQLLGKTSTKKYQAILDAACKDNRVRGLTQYYGAGRTGRWCLTGDHEVLTPEGWRRLDVWHGGPIMCWSPAGEQLSFQVSTCVSFPYEGDMVAYTSQRCAQVATPDHKMPTLNRAGDWVPRTVGDIGRHRVTIPFTGYGYTRIATAPDQLRVLLMTQADGHYTDTGAVRYQFAKDRKIERCKKLLRRCGLPFTERMYDGHLTITVPARHVPLWLRQFKNKTFGYWMLYENPEVIFDEIAEWDGYRCGPNSLQYTTCNEQNADVIQACALFGGYSATKLVKKRNKPNWSDAYIVNIWLNPGRGSAVRAEQIETVPFTGTVYCASTPTGYFAVRRNGVVWITGNSGRRVQLQNLAQNHLEDIDKVRQLVRDRDLETLELAFDNVPDVLSQLIRTALVAKPGHTFLVADYAAIEARVIAYLAGEKWRMDVFAAGGDIYCSSASQMFKVPVVKHGINGHLRQKGKIAELACGYGGGVGALKAFGADKMGLTEDEMQDIVTQWRAASPTIPRFWSDTEKAAKRALENPGRTFSIPCGVKYRRDADALRCLLPSGRVLSYWGARIEEYNGRPSVVFMGQNQTTRKWEKIETWGGKLVENIVQAYARDCLAVALVRLADAGYDIVFHVHDEIIAEAPKGSRWEDMADIMGQPIDWAPGLLLRGDGYKTDFYMKD